MGCSGSKSDTSKKPLLTGFNTDTLSTGDLVLFSSENPQNRTLLQSATQNRWQHVALAVHLPQLYAEHGILLLESAAQYSDGLVDVLTSKVRTGGVRLVDLHSRLRVAGACEIAVRRWQPSCDDERLSTATVFAAIVKHSGNGHAKKSIQVVRYRAPTIPPPLPSSAQLVASCLHDVGLLRSSSVSAKAFAKSSLSTVDGRYAGLEFVQKVS